MNTAKRKSLNQETKIIGKSSKQETEKRIKDLILLASSDLNKECFRLELLEENLAQYYSEKRTIESTMYKAIRLGILRIIDKDLAQIVE